MPDYAVLARIILLPTAHFLISILFLGAGLLLLLRERFPRAHFPAPGNFLAAVAVGTLGNALQFALVLLLYGRLPLHSQFWLSAGKYAMDLSLLLLVFLAHGRKCLEVLRDLAGPLRRGGNAALALLSLLLGVVAVLNFPHVHDSVQLMATNSVLVSGADFWPAKRIGLGFAAMVYFPTALWRSLPMATLAAGFKPALFLLSSQAVIFGIDRLGTVHGAANKFLYYVILFGSCFGLHGLMDLGKDSAWGVLFFLIFLFSLMAREKRGPRRFEPLLYAAAAMALGMITIPYLCVFMAIWGALRLLPEKISAHRLLFPSVVVLLLALGALQMPARLAIANPPQQKEDLGSHAYWYPLEGETGFVSYLFAFSRRGCRNSPWPIAAGFLGILLLPLARKRFADAAVRSTALLIPVTACGFLLFTRLARGIVPDSRHQGIPFTPLSFFDAWNLIKDIPQWLVQAVVGIFLIILLDTLLRRLPPSAASPGPWRTLYLGVAALAAVLTLAANFSLLASLRRPALFLTYGGNKNRHFALIMESIHRHPGLKRLYVQPGSSALVLHDFNYELKGYFPGRAFRVLDDAHVNERTVQARRLPLLLVARRDFLARFSQAAEKHGSFQIRELEYFQDVNEGAFVVGRKNTDLTAALRRSPRPW